MGIGKNCRLLPLSFPINTPFFPRFFSFSRSLVPLLAHPLFLSLSPRLMLSFILSNSNPWDSPKPKSCCRFSRSWYHSSRTQTEGRKQSHRNFAAMRVSSIEEGPSTRFWLNCRKEQVFATYTQFIISLAAGTLELETFRQFIAQDAHFLRAFTQAYETAEACADDDDAKAGMRKLRNVVLEELKLHSAFVQEWGLDLSKQSTPNSATLKYTEFILATAAGKINGGKGITKIVTPFEKTKIAAYTLGATIPCRKLYNLLAKEVRFCLDPSGISHPFKKWINYYASERFEEAALQSEELLDQLTIFLTGEELEVIEKLYHETMDLGIEILCSQPIVHRTVVPLARVLDPADHNFVIFSDFDLTCTVVDSSAMLAEIAIITASKADKSEPENQVARKSSADLRKSWDLLSIQYTAEHQQCVKSIMPSLKVDAFDYEGLCKALEKLSVFEKRANTRVIESAVLKGLNLEDIKRAGARLVLQDGCMFFFQQIVKTLKADVHILSYCWCGDLIRSAFSSGGLGVLNVHSNEFSYEDSVSTGEIVRKVESPMDKLQNFKDILENRGGNGRPLSVYIGDSVGDLLCLLEADVGIVIGSSSTLRRVGRRYGVLFVPLFSGLVKKQKELDGVESSHWKGSTGTVYTVSSWAEIHGFILGS